MNKQNTNCLLTGISGRLIAVPIGNVHEILDIKQLDWKNELLRSGWEPAIYRNRKLNVLLLQETCRLSSVAFGRRNEMMSTVILMNDLEKTIEFAGLMVDDIYGVISSDANTSNTVFRLLNVAGLFEYMKNPACYIQSDLLLKREDGS